MAGRHSVIENGVVAAMTGALMIGPDVADAGARIEGFRRELLTCICETQRAVNAGDYHTASIWLGLADNRIEAMRCELARDFAELDARTAEIKAATLRAFPHMKIVSEPANGR